MVSDTVQDVNQVLHNVGMAAWVGARCSAASRTTRRCRGSPPRRARRRRQRGLERVQRRERSRTDAVGLGHLAGRLTELRSSNLSDRKRPFVRAMDALTEVGLTTGVLSAIQSARQAPGGAVPVETGTQPAPETPAAAARIQRSLDVLGLVNVASGVRLVAAAGLYWRSAASRPPARRALRRRARR